MRRGRGALTVTRRYTAVTHRYRTWRSHRGARFRRTEQAWGVRSRQAFAVHARHGKITVLSLYPLKLSVPVTCKAVYILYSLGIFYHTPLTTHQSGLDRLIYIPNNVMATQRSTSHSDSRPSRLGPLAAVAARGAWPCGWNRRKKANRADDDTWDHRNSHRTQPHGRDRTSTGRRCRGTRTRTAHRRARQQTQQRPLMRASAIVEAIGEYGRPPAKPTLASVAQTRMP